MSLEVGDIVFVHGVGMPPGCEYPSTYDPRAWIVVGQYAEYCFVVPAMKFWSATGDEYRAQPNMAPWVEKTKNIELIQRRT